MNLSHGAEFAAGTNRIEIKIDSKKARIRIPAYSKQLKEITKCLRYGLKALVTESCQKISENENEFGSEILPDNDSNHKVF